MPDGFNPFAESRTARQRHTKAVRMFIEDSAALETILLRALTHQVEMVAAAIERGDDPMKVLVIGPLEEVYGAFYREAIPHVALATVQHANLFPVASTGRSMRGLADLALNTWHAFVRHFLENEGAVRMRHIMDTLRRMVAGVLAEYFEEGPIVVAQKLRKQWRDSSPARTRRIARTELLGAVNLGSLEGARALANELDLVLQKEWLWSGIQRKTHADVDGQRRGIDEDFLVDDEFLRYPGDHSASPHNVINCGCTTAYAVDE